MYIYTSRSSFKFHSLIQFFPKILNKSTQQQQPYTPPGSMNRQLSISDSNQLPPDWRASSRVKKCARRRVFKETRHPVYGGVRRRNNNKWVCEVREPNKKTRIWLGTYPTAEMAARAHDVAALALRGKQACLNFADSAWRLPVPASMDPLGIRRAAAEAAETFRPQEFGGVCEDNYNNNYLETGESIAMSNEAEQNNEVLYEDEEDMFDMPTLLTNLAEGLLLSPPPRYMDATSSSAVDDLESAPNFGLWSYSD